MEGVSLFSREEFERYKRSIIPPIINGKKKERITPSLKRDIRKDMIRIVGKNKLFLRRG